MSIQPSPRKRFGTSLLVLLVDYINNQQERDKMEALAAAKAAEHRLKLDAAQSSIFIIHTLVDFVDPKLATQIATVGTSALQIADSLSGWLDAVSGLSGLDKIGSLSTVVMTGNVLGAVMNVVSLFGDTGPTPDQLILEEIGKLRQDVSQLRTEMHERFDRIDTELNTIYSTMQERFNLIDLQLGKLNGKLDEVQKSLVEIDLKLSRIERNNFEFLNVLGRRPLLDAINGGLAYQARTGVPMPYQPEFVDFENVLHGWGTIHAFDALNAGPTQRDYSAGQVLAELNAYPLDSNINYLNGWLTANGLPALTTKRLASPRDWLFASRAYSQLATEWPAHMQRIDPQRQAALDAIGAELEAAMHRISTQNTLTGTVGNQLLFSNVITNYQDKLDRLDTEIRSLESAFVGEIQTTRLQRREPFDLYAGIDQALSYQAPGLSNLTCGSPAQALPVPNNTKALTPNFTRYNLAEYLKLGNLTTCIAGTLVNRKTVCLPKQPDLCHMEGDLVVWLTVYFGATPITIQSIDGERISLEDNDDPTNYVSTHWGSFKSVFESANHTVAPTAEQAARRAALLATTTANLERQLAAYQHELYGRVENELTQGVGTTKSAAIALAGGKALLDSFVTLGLTRAVSDDDFVHAMLYGNQQLVADSAIVQSYAISATQPITGADLLVNPRWAIEQTATARTATLTGLINHYLEAITAHTHVEALDYIANTRRELDLAVRIAQLEPAETPAPTPIPSPTPPPAATLTPAVTPIATPMPGATPLYLPLIER